MGMWSEVACLLEDLAPPQDWRQVEVKPEAVRVALGIISRYFEKQSACEAAETVGWMLLTVLKRSTEEIQEMVAQERELQISVDSLRNKMALIREEAA